MDKRQLNQEIILCRSTVKRAKVCVIRKLIKKIKILRSCKDSKLKEKKFRKARRLAAEIHVMKSLRPDYVTKFALITEDYVPTGSNTKLKRKRNACAKLSKHRDLLSKVTSIRDKFSNWREDLPPLLASVKKKSEEEQSEAPEREQVIANINNNNDNPEVPVDTVTNRLMENEEGESIDEEPKLLPAEVPKAKTPKSRNANTNKKRKKKDDSAEDEETKEQNENTENEKRELEEKVEDPFFIGKKIIVPKLMQKGNENHPENEGKLNDDLERELKQKKRVEREVTKDKKVKFARHQPLPENDLHPSWKAKKMQTIKPFEGKKIKFE